MVRGKLLSRRKGRSAAEQEPTAETLADKNQQENSQEDLGALPTAESGAVTETQKTASTDAPQSFSFKVQTPSSQADLSDPVAPFPSHELSLPMPELLILDFTIWRLLETFKADPQRSLGEEWAELRNSNFFKKLMALDTAYKKINECKGSVTLQGSNIYLSQRVLLARIFHHFVIAFPELLASVDHWTIEEFLKHPTLTGLIKEGYFIMLGHDYSSSLVNHADFIEFLSYLHVLHELVGHEGTTDGPLSCDLVFEKVSDQAEFRQAFTAAVQRLEKDVFDENVSLDSKFKSFERCVVQFLITGHNLLTTESQPFLLALSSGVAFNITDQPPQETMYSQQLVDEERKSNSPHQAQREVGMSAVIGQLINEIQPGDEDAEEEVASGTVPNVSSPRSKSKMNALLLRNIEQETSSSSQDYFEDSQTNIDPQMKTKTRQRIRKTVKGLQKTKQAIDAANVDPLQRTVSELERMAPTQMDNVPGGVSEVDQQTLKRSAEDSLAETPRKHMYGEEFTPKPIIYSRDLQRNPHLGRHPSFESPMMELDQVMNVLQPISPYPPNIGPSPRKRAPRHPWTDDEVQALERGMMEFHTQWAEILKHYGENGIYGNQLRNRTQVQLKDKARNERYRRMRENLPLGPFYCATNYPEPYSERTM